MVQKKELLFEGNEKQVFATDDPEQVIFRFKDVATAYNGVKKAIFPGKGVVDTAISSFIFEYLRANGVTNTHYVSRAGDREMLCRKIQIIPLEIVVCNYVSGALADRLGLEVGKRLSPTVYHLHYNNAELGDPFISDTEAEALGLIPAHELEYMYRTARRINELLFALFERAELKLVELKLEFGRACDGTVIVSDEISPDTCRFWDAVTDKPLDKDRFRHDLGYIVASYEEVLNRLQTLEIA